jgi:hypothetical protein
MMTWRYKCRLCQMVFWEEQLPTDNTLNHTALLLEVMDAIRGQYLVVAHQCSTWKCGVADLVGAEIRD